jgi:phytanoyl-CoA hydroxylase
VTEAAAAHPADLYSDERLAPVVEDLAAVGPREHAFFHEHGFLAIGQVITPERAAAASQAVDELIDGANPDFRGVQFEPGSGRRDDLPAAERRLHVRKLMSYVEYHPQLLALSRHTGLLGLLQQLMDGDDPDSVEPHLFQDMALLKPPGGREKPWHQDMAYFNVPVDTPVIGVWIALDEATVDNGALHVIPGSHRDGPQNHFKRRDWQICDTDIGRGRDVVAPLPAGGALLWHGLTQHGSPTNRSTSRRRALQFHYRPASVEETTTEVRMQVYGGEVRGADC